MADGSRGLTPAEEAELVALLEWEERQRERERVAQQEGGWEQEKRKCGWGADTYEEAVRGCLHWFDHYAMTYDPRKRREPSRGFLRFSLWPKQREAVEFILWLIFHDEEGLWEKSRDTGASYVCVGVCLWAWLALPGFKATFGSRIIDYVDKKDNPDAIFTKLRIMLNRLPSQLLPRGFNPVRHDKFAQLTNPENDSIISGEGGENMGRGGRSSIYILDEAAHVPNAEDVEAALSGNTDCVLWVSSVNGMGNLFARKRHGLLPARNIFRLHYKDDPRKDAEWVAKKKRQLSDPARWASEFEIDYTASVEGICIPAAWVRSCQELVELEPKLRPSNAAVLGLDVGAGKAKSVAVARAGPCTYPPHSRGDPDTTETALWALDVAVKEGASTLKYDAPGVGHGVKSGFKHNPRQGIAVEGINTGDSPSNTLWVNEDKRATELFANLKAEIWWTVRVAAERTHEHVLALKGEGGQLHPNIDELLALPSGDPESETLTFQLSLVKWFRTEKGKIMIETKDQLRKRGIPSPDYADAFVLTYAPTKPRARIGKVRFGAR